MRRASFNQRARKRQGTGRGLRRCLLCWGPIGSVTALTSPSWVAVDADFLAFGTGATLTERSLAVAATARHSTPFYYCYYVYSFLKDLACRVHKVSGEVKSFSYLLQCLAVAVQRGNAVSVLGTFAREDCLVFEDSDAY